MDSAEVGAVLFVRHPSRRCRNVARNVAFGEWNAGKTSEPDARTFQSRDAMGVFRPQSDHTCAAVSQAHVRSRRVLTVEEIGKLLLELREPWRTAIFVAVTTGLRVSELLGLKWGDVDFASGEIHLSRGIVRQHIGEMKTEASRRPVPMETGLAGVLARWREMAPYNQDGDYIFASPDKHGTQPYWPNAAMEDHITTSSG